MELVKFIPASRLPCNLMDTARQHPNPDAKQALAMSVTLLPVAVSALFPINGPVSASKSRSTTLEATMDKSKYGSMASSASI